MRISGVLGATVSIDNNLGCQVGDVALTIQPSDVSATPACTLKRVTGIVGTTQVILDSTAGVSIGDGLSCMTGWTRRVYSIVGNTLMENAMPIASEIVNLQAQYGVSLAAADNQVANWVDATGAWAAPSVADRKRIKAIRIAVFARSNLLERDPVPASAACSSLTDPAPTGVCAWAGSNADPAPSVDLSNNADSTRYRYRVFETIIPLRNIIANVNTL